VFSQGYEAEVTLHNGWRAQVKESFWKKKFLSYKNTCGKNKRKKKYLQCLRYFLKWYLSE